MTTTSDSRWRVGSLITSNTAILPTATCGEVLERLRESAHEQVLPVVADGRPVGIIDRARYLAEFARPYRHELYWRKPIGVQMDRGPIMVECDTTVDSAHDLIARRSTADALPAGFIAVRDGAYAGTVLSVDVFRRMTELTAMQNRELIKTREQLAGANRAKSDFLANMSHELRTPLNAIIGFSDLMRQEVFGPLNNARYSAYAGDIHYSATHLLEMINELLDFERIAAGKLDLKDEPVDLAERIASGISLVAPIAEQAGLMLRSDSAPGLPALRADAKRILQIVLNLLSNAIKFTPQGGEVRVGASLRDDGGIRLAVTDTGIGVAPGDIERILSPFGRVESSYVRNQEGTGLGLPLTKQLAELHGGRLDIDSRLGGGTTVRIDFPPERSLGSAAHRVA